MAGTLELVIKTGSEMIPGEWESRGVPILSNATAAEALVIATALWGVTDAEAITEPTNGALGQWACQTREYVSALLTYWPESEVRTVAVPTGGDA